MKDFEIYGKKRKELTSIFKQYLAEQYPQFEKDNRGYLFPRFND